MKYYRVNDRGDMSPYYKRDGRNGKVSSPGFLVKNELYTEKELKKIIVSNLDFDIVEIKKTNVKKYSSGSRYEKGVWF